MLGLELFILTAFVATALYAGAEDWKRYEIPNSVSVALIGLFLLLSLATSAIAFLPSFILACCVLVIGFLFFVKGWLGAGDVKFLTAASLFAGPPLLPLFLYVIALSGGLLSVLFLVKSRLLSTTAQKVVRLPYGAAIAVGCCWLFWQRMEMTPAL